MVSEVLVGLILIQTNKLEGRGGISFVKYDNRCFSLCGCVWNGQQESSKQQPVSYYGSFHSIWFFGWRLTESGAYLYNTIIQKWYSFFKIDEVGSPILIRIEIDNPDAETVSRTPAALRECSFRSIVHCSYSEKNTEHSIL